MITNKHITPVLEESDLGRASKKEDFGDKYQESKKLTAVMDSQRSSHTLNLADQFIGDEGAPLVAEFLSRYSHFTIVELRGNNLSSEGFSLICQVLKDNTKLIAILAEWNLIGNNVAGFDALHELVKTSRSLATLDFRNNRIKPNAAPIIASIIRDSQSLEFFDLRWNDLGNEGAKQILDALRSQNRRIRVDLSGNKVSEDLLAAIQEITEGVTKPTTEQPRYKASTIETTKKEPLATIDTNQPIVQSPPQQQTEIQGQTTSPMRKSPPRTVTFSELKNSKYLNEYMTTGPPKDIYYNVKTVVNPSPPRIKGQPTETAEYVRRYIYEGVADVKDDIKEPASYSYSNPILATPMQKTQPPPVVSTNKDAGLSSNKDIGLFSNYKTYTENKPTTTTGLAATSYQPGLSTYQPGASTYQPGASTYQPGASTYQPPNFSMFSQTSPDLRGSQLRASAIKPPSYQPEMDLKKIQSLYEQEAKEIQQKYQTFIDTHAKMAQTLQDLEAQLNEERERANQLEASFRAAAKEAEGEKRVREQLEEKCLEIGEELRQKDILCSDLALRCEMLTQDAQHLRADNQKLNDELRRVDEQCNSKIRDIEAQHMNQVGELSVQLEGMRREFERMAQAHSTQLKDLTRDWETKIQRQEEQLRDSKRALTEQENQIKAFNEYVQKLQATHQEDLKRVEGQIRNEEGQKLQQTIRAAETEIKRIADERDDVAKKFDGLIREVQGVERKMNDERAAWQNEERRLREEIERLKVGMSKFDEERNRWRQEVQSRDEAIARMAGDVENFKRGQERLLQEHNAEKKKMADALRDAENKHRELERVLRIAEEDVARSREEYDRMKEVLQGNINKLISQTFFEHSARVSQKPF